MLKNLLNDYSFSKEILIKDFVLSLCLCYSSGVTLCNFYSNFNAYQFSLISLLPLIPIVFLYLLILAYKSNSKSTKLIYFFNWIDMFMSFLNYFTLYFESGTKLFILAIMIHRKILIHKIQMKFTYREKLIFTFTTGFLIELQIISTIQFSIIRFAIYSSYITENCFNIIIENFKQIQYNFMDGFISRLDASQSDSPTYCIFNNNKGILFSNHKYHEIVKSSSHSNSTEFLKNLSYIKLASLYDIVSSNNPSNQNELLLVRNRIEKSKPDSYLILSEKENENKIIKFFNFSDQEKAIQQKIHKIYIGIIELFFTHEARNQLNPIKSLLKNFINSNKLEELIVSLSHLKILCSKIDLLSDYASIQKNEFIPKLEKFYPVKFINSIKNLILKIEKKKMNQISLICSIDPLTPNCIYIDKQRLKNVFLHIILNAVKFTFMGSISIISQYSKDNNELILMIDDTGIGMSKNQKLRLFTLIEESQCEDENGQKIMKKFGSYICSQICKVSGWKIKVSSKVKGGTVFFLSLPNVRIINETLNTYDETCIISNTPLFRNFPAPNLIQMKIPKMPKAKLLSTSKLMNEKRTEIHLGVLVVDDMDMNRDVLLRMIKSIDEFVDCYEAVNGLKAIEKIKEIHVKYSKIIIFMDIDMPIMNGIDSSKVIRSLNCPNIEINIYAVTAYDSKEMRDKCKEAGMDDYFVKPIKFSTLKSLLNKIKL